MVWRNIAVAASAGLLRRNRPSGSRRCDTGLAGSSCCSRRAFVQSLPQPAGHQIGTGQRGQQFRLVGLNMQWPVRA